MNDLATRRNVTSRLDDAEDMVGALVIRADALLQAGKALSVRVAQLEDRCQALNDELALLNRLQFAAFQSFTEFKTQSVLRRLRWVVLGG